VLQCSKCGNLTWQCTVLARALPSLPQPHLSLLGAEIAMRKLLIVVLFLGAVYVRVDAVHHGLRLSLDPYTVDKDAGPAAKPLSAPEKEAILQRLRDRKAALERLALEDALGLEAKEQAQSEANTLSDLGGAPFIGVNEQNAKISVSQCAQIAVVLGQRIAVRLQAKESVVLPR
jgi:hypothetical protein